MEEAPHLPSAGVSSDRAMEHMAMPDRRFWLHPRNDTRWAWP
ncbi:hypothetical protein F8B43_5670 [Methylorubrum populi]|uniref:Uncharacterized protein n=1 Tax=Methylorubrum populi TaxID=223967 RepID=A0A833J1G3_9HYPH|nr:hypothetical protein F8B43_5670 [Methylorubrum populi]